jgi:GNAT superfamily N-acetyltransferase
MHNIIQIQHRLKSMYTFRDVKNYITNNGWQYFLTMPLRRINKNLFIFEKGIVYFFNCEKIFLKQPDQSIIVRRATIDDIDKLRELNPNTTLFREFLKNDEIFIIALANEKIVGHVCFVKNVPKRFEGFINLQPDELWLREVLILQGYRNKGIYSRIFSFAVFHAKKQRYTKVFSNILSHSKNSIEIHTKKFGFIPAFSYNYIKFLFFEKTWFNRI